MRLEGKEDRTGREAAAVKNAAGLGSKLGFRWVVVVCEPSGTFQLSATILVAPADNYRTSRIVNPNLWAYGCGVHRTWVGI